MDYDGISYSHRFLVLGSRFWREQQTGFARIIPDTRPSGSLRSRPVDSWRSRRFFPPAGENDGLGRQCESQSVTFFETPKVTEKNRQRNSEHIQLPGSYYHWPGNPVIKPFDVAELLIIQTNVAHRMATKRQAQMKNYPSRIYHLCGALAEWIAALGLSQVGLLLALMGFYIIIGCFLDGISAVVLTMAVVEPMVRQAGIDIIWFGIFIVVVVEMAQITPPIGFNLFVMQGIAKQEIGYVARTALPMFLLMVVMVGILIAFPEIATWLPDSARNAAR